MDEIISISSSVVACRGKKSALKPLSPKAMYTVGRNLLSALLES